MKTMVGRGMGFMMDIYDFEKLSKTSKMTYSDLGVLL